MNLDLKLKTPVLSEHEVMHKKNVARLDIMVGDKFSKHSAYLVTFVRCHSPCIFFVLFFISKTRKSFCALFRSPRPRKDRDQRLGMDLGPPPPPPVARQTDTCENITFTHPSDAVGWYQRLGMNLGPETGVPLPPVDRQTDNCENITFPYPSDAVGNYD